MKKFIFALLMVCLLTTAVRGEERTPRLLTLDEAIGQALKSNLDLQIAVTNPAIADALARKSGAIFIPVFSIRATKGKTTSPSYNSIFTGAPIDTSENFNMSMGVTQTLPIGGQLEVALDSARSKSNSKYSSVNPRINSTLTFSLTQPLLKNFGTFATRKNIIVAENSRRQSVFALKQSVIDMIYTVEEAYWNLVYANQNLEVRRKSLELARDLLKQNETQVKVGVSAPMDVLAAKAEVAARDSDTLTAESQVQTAAENLRRILNAPDEGNLQPADRQPAFEPRQADFNGFLQAALENRPDVQQARLDLKSKNVEVRYSRNQLLPDLQLTASYYTSGLSGDQIIWDGNPLLPGSTIIGQIQGDIWDALKDVVSNLYRNYSIGLQLTIPLANSAARADLTRARLNLKQSLLQLKKAESTTYSDVKQAVSDLEANYKIVEANRIARELAEQKLAAEQKKLSVGLSTNYLVLQYQRDYANALSAELKSMIDYKMTLSRTDRVTGRTLETHNVQFDDFLAH